MAWGYEIDDFNGNELIEFDVIESGIRYGKLRNWLLLAAFGRNTRTHHSLSRSPASIGN